MRLRDLLAKIRRGEGPKPEDLAEAISGTWEVNAPTVTITNPDGSPTTCYPKSYEPGNTPEDLFGLSDEGDNDGQQSAYSPAL